MATPEDVQKLAALARIEIPEAELGKFATEFDSIISYIDQLGELTIPKQAPLLPYVNAFREDEHPHEAGKYTEKIAAQFPAHEGDSLVVKQIISHD